MARRPVIGRLTLVWRVQLAPPSLLDISRPPSPTAQRVSASLKASWWRVALVPEKRPVKVLPPSLVTTTAPPLPTSVPLSGPLNLRSL